MCRQFSTMIDAGVSLVRCMDVLGEQTQNARLRRILIDLQQGGRGRPDAVQGMAKYPKVFNNLFVGLVRAGEVGGVLEETLQRLSTFLEKDVEMRRKVKSAMTYPIIVIVVAVGIVVGLCTFIVPKFIDLFKSLGVKDFPAADPGPDGLLQLPAAQVLGLRPDLRRRERSPSRRSTRPSSGTTSATGSSSRCRSSAS